MGATSQNVLVCSDSQAPFNHKKYIEFHRYALRHYRCVTAVHIGDLVDFRFLSSHGLRPDPNDEHTPTQELDAAKDFIKELQSKIPLTHILSGNHEKRIIKRAKEAGIPVTLLKKLHEILGIKSDIKVVERLHHYGNRVLLQHGDACNRNLIRAAAQACEIGISVVFGHHSSAGGVHYHSRLKHGIEDQRQTIFAMNVGGCIDEQSYGMAWAKQFHSRITQGCGVLTWDAKKRTVIPIFIPMN